MGDYDCHRRYYSRGSRCFQPSSSSPGRTQSPCCDPVNEDIQQKLGNCQWKNNNGVSREVFNLQGEHNCAQARNSPCCDELEHTRQKVSQKEVALVHHGSKLCEMQYEMRNQDIQHRRMTSKLNEDLAVCQDSCQQKEACHKDVSQLKSQLENACAELKEKKCHNEKLDLALLEVKGRYNAAAVELDESKKTVTCLKGKISNLESQSKRDRQHFDSELQNAHARVQKATDEARHIAEGLKALKSLLQEKECEVRVSNEEKKVVCQQLNCEHERVMKLTVQVENKQCEISDLQSELEHVKCEVDKQCKEMKCCRSQLQEKHNEVSVLCNAKQTLESDIQKLICQFEKEKSNFQKTLVERQKCFEKEISHHKSCIRTLEENNCSLKAEVRSCREEMKHEYCAQLDQMSKEVACLRAQLQDREIQLSSIRDSVNEKNSEIIRMCAVDGTCSAERHCSKDFCQNNASA